MLGYHIRKWLNFLSIISFIFYGVSTEHLDSINVDLRNFWAILWPYVLIGIPPTILFFSAIRSMVRGTALFFDQVGETKYGFVNGIYSSTREYIPRIKTDRRNVLLRLFLSGFVFIFGFGTLAEQLHHRYSNENLRKIAEHVEYVKNSIKHSMGENFGGGVIVFVSDQGAHGLIVETKPAWFGYVGYDDKKIKNIIANPVNHSEEGQKYSDWRLPSRYELEVISTFYHKSSHSWKNGIYLAEEKENGASINNSKYIESKHGMPGTYLNNGSVYLVMVRDF